MKRKCDRCESEATVHEVVIRNGQKAEKHLCDSCAREEGFTGQATAPISDLITKFVISQSAGEKNPAKAGICPTCGLTFNDFRQHGLLGCPDCYKAFELQLTSMIERAHEGATHHIGKTPKRMGSVSGRSERITALRKQLSDAISAEQYERAATLRDQLLHVEKNPPVVTEPPRPAAKKRTDRGSAP